MSATRAFARALSASLCFGVSAGELARHKTLEQITKEAKYLAQIHRSVAYVYRRADGVFQPSTLEAELLPAGPDAEIVATIDPALGTSEVIP